MADIDRLVEPLRSEAVQRYPAGARDLLAPADSVRHGVPRSGLVDIRAAARRAAVGRGRRTRPVAAVAPVPGRGAWCHRRQRATIARGIAPAESLQTVWPIAGVHRPVLRLLAICRAG